MSNSLGPYSLDTPGSCGPFPISFVPQYNDLMLPVISARIPAANYPALAALTTNIGGYTFAAGDYVDLSTAEVLHGYKEGTDLDLHLHLVTNGTEVVDTKAQYVIYYSWGNVNSSALGTEQSVTGEVTIPAGTTDRTHLFLDMGDAAGMGQLIGSAVACRVTRIAKTAGGADPAANPFIISVGIHYQQDSLGSISETTK